MVLLSRIKRHPAVESLEHESENGWWIYLKTGWIDGEAMTHAIREDTLGEAAAKLKFVRKKTANDPS